MQYSTDDKGYFANIRKQFRILNDATDEEVEEFLERSAIIEFCGLTETQRKTMNSRFYADKIAIKIFKEKENETIS